jgi:RNA polymerase sigma factor (sigma-70 family)
VTNAPQGDAPGDEPGDRLRWSNETARRVEELYRAYSRSLYSYLRALGLDPDTANEVVHETFIKLGDFLERGGRISDSPKAYVFKTGRNTMIDRFRRKDEKYSTPTDEPEDFDDTAAEQAFERFIELFSKRDDLLRLRVAITELPRRQREVVLMHMDDFSNPEIADSLGLSRGAVRYHLSMGLRRLRLLLDLGEYGNE